MRILLVLTVALAACGAPGAAPIPTPSRSPLPETELKYRVVDEVGRPWYCDPDEYPVARGDELERARERLPQIRIDDADTYSSIVRHHGLTPAAVLTDEQTLAVYRDWKLLNALPLQPVGDVFGFALLVQAPGGMKEGVHVEGRVDRSGRVVILRTEAAAPPMCPICLAATTAIATPNGPVPVAALRTGTLVWTRGAHGERIAAPVLEVASAEAPSGHEVLRIILADRRTVTASPLHPTADGRPLAALSVGSVLDGSRVLSIEWQSYRGRTYDLLPGGPTGLYWADGVVLASTISPSSRVPPRRSPPR